MLMLKSPIKNTLLFLKGQGVDLKCPKKCVHHFGGVDKWFL